MELIHLQGERYAAGLVWYALEEGGDWRRAADEIIESVETPTHYAMRESGAIRTLGLASEQGGEAVAKGTEALAAALADVRPGNWFGCWRLDETSAYVLAVRGGELAGGCEDVYSLDHARTLIEEYRGETGAWDSEEVNIESAEEGVRALEALVAESEGAAKLAPVGKGFSAQRKRRWRLAGVGALVLVGVIIAVVAVNKLQEQHAEQAAERAARIAQRNSAHRAALAARQGPWSKAPAPDRLYTACLSHVLAHRLIYAGWHVAMISCSASGVTYTWKAGSPAAWSRLVPSAVSDIANPDTLTTRSLFALSPLGWRGKLLRKQAAARAFYALGARVGLAVPTLRFSAPSGSRRGHRRKGPPPKVNATFAIKGGVGAFDQFARFSRGLKTIRGAVLSGVDIDPAKGTVTLHGALYANP